MKLGDTCDKAKSLITKERFDIHGNPENSFPIIRKLWNVFLKEKYGIELKLDSDVSFMMVLHKIGREIGGRCDDNIPDALGYGDIYEVLKYKEADLSNPEKAIPSEITDTEVFIREELPKEV